MDIILSLRFTSGRICAYFPRAHRTPQSWWSNNCFIREYRVYVFKKDNRLKEHSLIDATNSIDQHYAEATLGNPALKIFG